MEMQQLRYVVAVARTGNFSRAAEQCHVSQPSLSQQIQKLEEELGGRLFDRMKRGMEAKSKEFVEKRAEVYSKA
jgi:LysR family hydrogen peroxide-inducible transcriptional activator